MYIVLTFISHIVMYFRQKGGGGEGRGGSEGGRMRKKRKKKKRKTTYLVIIDQFGTKIFHLWSDTYLSVINIDFQL